MTTQPFGNLLFDLVISIFIACWVLGWLLLLALLALQYVMPARAAWFHRISQSAWKVLTPVLKYTGLAALALVAIYMVAQMLGWAPPSPPGEVST